MAEVTLPINGVFEVAVRVKDLSRAESFCRDVLGFEPGIRDERRNWLFLWAGGRRGMVVLQEDKGEWPLQHFAFTVSEADIDQATASLRDRGLEVQGPVSIGWMEARSIYFSDPDGHQLELCALG